MRKFLCITLIFIICSCCIYSFADDENNVNVNTGNNTSSSNTTSSEMSNLQEQQKEIQTQMEQYGEDLAKVQDELTENLEQVQVLDEKIEKAETELSELDEKIKKLTQSTLQLRKKLKEATRVYEKQKKLLESRLVAMYETGDTEYLDVVLSSSDLSEFLSSYVLITEIATYDTELLDDVEEKKEIIELANTRLQENLKKLDLMRENQIKNTAILQNIKKLRQEYIAKLSTEEKKIQDQIDQYRAQFEQVNKEILEIALEQGLSTEYIGGVLEWPVPGYTKITSKYGMRVHPITGVYKLHTGVDISAPTGANFVAANDGIVTKANYNGAYGNMVMVDHGGGISTLYAHGSEILVKVGQTVTRGEPVLKVGSTGYSTGPHAHFEVRINGVVTDPIEYITKSKIPETANKEKTNSAEDEKKTANTNTDVITSTQTDTQNTSKIANPMETPSSEQNSEQSEKTAITQASEPNALANTNIETIQNDKTVVMQSSEQTGESIEIKNNDSNQVINNNTESKSSISTSIPQNETNTIIITKDDPEEESEIIDFTDTDKNTKQTKTKQ